ncbi:aminopeptidase P family protein [Bizionia argentinensis JUB59]|uniref:Aminopeptidase P family protein n=1 Tax=Bizionia argentinensis JUB59 TaxID=1046627 RepID=G2EAN6_9FLAO|nr:aminopeptidase P family protein [Bizionia argentinensis]EGV44475.1 aminopeptidase P family protein [Bizionia argentinensis JUB59]
MTAKEKVASLRAEMKKNNIDAFIVYSADPHMGEYLPAEWQERTWLSGFTGSAGFVVVTANKAGLWTDGRYFTQGPEELKGSGIDLFKDGVEGTPNYIDWIISETSDNATIAVNGLATSHANWEALKNKCTKHKRNLKDLPLLNNVWTKRPAASKNAVFVQPIERAGQSVTYKIAAIREKMKAEGATSHVISSLDDVAWTLNLRGSDVQCNPVFLSYVLLTLKDCFLFVDLNKLDENAQNLMKKSGVKLKSYDSFFDYLGTLNNESILIAPNSNQSVFEAVKKDNTIIEKPVPGHVMKAIKNETEQEGFRTVMVRDGVAMVKFLHWLTHTVGKEDLDEYTIGKKLHGFRAEGKNFIGASFDSIVGYKGNGAIIHYSAKSEGSAKVTNDSSILVDSGGQYLEGTTDITRTFPLGDVSDEFKKDATLALQGMIQLSMVKFPKGTRGVQLDALARMPLWKEGKDFNHGTGHGVGSFLNVHEGPMSIRKDLNPNELQEGMVLSNEPGYYVEGKYGIRHENLILINTWKTTEWNTFYEFETLTLCPFFKSIIVKDLLSKEEIDWMNTYHKLVQEKLKPHLEGDVKTWFEDLVSPI